MDFVWSTVRKDLRRRFRDPMALLLWLGMRDNIAVAVRCVVHDPSRIIDAEDPVKRDLVGGC